MKCLYTVFLLFLFFPAFSQTQIIDSIPKDGIVLNKGWKFHPGDHAEWVTPDFDDGKWQSINPTLDVHDSLFWLSKTGICWFRLHFKTTGSNLTPLVLQIWQSGASEIYLNGRMIQKYGTLKSNPFKIKAYNPLEKPIPFPIKNDTNQVLAVRFALQPDVRYSTHWGIKNPAINITVNTFENAFERYNHKYINYNEQSYFRVGVLMVLGILYLTFLLFHIEKRVNLHFFLYTLLMATGWYYFIYADTDFHTVALYYYVNNIILISQVFAFLLILTGIYLLLRQTKKNIYYSLLTLGFISIICSVFIYGWGWLIYGYLLSNLVNLDILRVAFVSIKKHKKGAWIIMSGGLICVVSWVLTTIQHFGFLLNLSIDFFTVYWLSIPIAVSIYIGYDFALANRSLKDKLIEIENLSSEKQAILSSQNETLEKQVTQRTSQLNQSLQELKSTQAQLIQSEKMASLGELTAGIAHEIQNPLNFVNNFSEVSSELLDEMNEALANGDTEELKNLTNDIKQNLEKINHHGKRADAIVKGMLQHSRQTKGVKELTDINKLCDEFLRLSYHGFRAKDKSFNAEFTTDFDESISKINIVPQDMGRVLLNLFNNAFYAVNEKKKTANEGYKPLVSVETKKQVDKIEIKVSDNGSGIPQNVINKIFQPFFTTKPTGSGTGLGLSLSYDIITKEHGGSIQVESKESEGATFIIQLSMN